MNKCLSSQVRRVLASALIAVLLSGAHAFAQTPSPSVTATPSPAVAATPSSPDIRDIRGPIPINSAWTWAIWLAAVALLATGAYLGWYWNRRRKLAAVKLPFEIALERLAAARTLMRPDFGRRFSIAVSGIVRLYIEERFHVMAAHRTTEEFLYDLLEPSDALLARHRAVLAGFLHYCDLAKFAGWSLTADDMETLYESARTFVLATGKPAVTVGTRKAPHESSGEEFYDSLPST